MFVINGEKWSLEFVDPTNSVLQRSDNSYTIGVTDANAHKIFIANNISGNLLKKVITHEMAHAYMISRDIFLPIQYEEILCDVIATNGDDIINMSKNIYNNLKRFYTEM